MILKPLGYQQITDLSSAVALTVPAGATRALIQANDRDVRFRDDGTDATAALGFRLRELGQASGRTLFYDGDLTALSLIETSSAAELNVSYYA